MIRKEFAKIGKFMLRELSSAISIYKELSMETPSSAQDDVAEESLVEATPSFSIEKIRLSKNQILQYIYYHFFPVDERGVVVMPAEKTIAKALNCSIRTVRNNNIALEKAGLIYHSHCGSRLNIWLLRYADYFEEGGSGYLELQFNRFQELVLIENINALRMELRLELTYDNNEVKRKMKKEDTGSISKNDLKIFLPKYTHYKGMLEKILNQCSTAFVTALNNISIQFKKRKDYVNAKEAKKLRKDEYRSLIEEKLQAVSHTGIFNQVDIMDFIQLCFEYGKEQVSPALDVLIHMTCHSTDQTEMIHNLGGMLRTIIRIQIEESIQGEVSMAI